jgi:phage tail sheath protein FI
MIKPLKIPGVYIQELKIGPKPIQGVTTNTTAFIGETQKGPNTPTLIKSWQQFQTIFGAYFGQEKYLPYTVEGFFLNGGQRCYIRKTTNNDYAAALAELEKIDKISLIYVPNVQAIQGLTDLIMDHCERMQSRFAIIDAVKGQAPSNVSKPKRASAYAAQYYPWIMVQESISNKSLLVPPGGHVVGIYAKTDIERGVNKPPANQIVKGAIDLEFTVNDGQQSGLNIEGINTIRSFSGRGIIVWGARTLAIDRETVYVSVQRLKIYLKQSITKGTAWVTFEPNNETTWAKVRLTVQDFLLFSWQNGMLMGSKPEQAFFVKCDRTTMTQNDIDNGLLIIEVGFAPVMPAEFIVFSVGQKTVTTT